MTPSSSGLIPTLNIGAPECLVLLLFARWPLQALVVVHLSVRRLSRVTRLAATGTRSQAVARI